ncbi:MAG: hypothetical protein KF687_01730 [Cyclobacteriaceae bacterium]|nr:hypothetical protein [Cyclobacteriaceae bacterium]
MIARLFSCGFLVLAIVANSQPFSTRFRKIDEVIRAHHVNQFTMLEDKEGYIWFGVEAGLARYDASNLNFFAGQNLGGNKQERPVARVIFEDTLRNIFVITSLGKLLQYDRLQDSFRPLNDSLMVLGTTARAVLADDLHRFWVAHLGEGLAHVDLNSQSIKWYRHDQSNPRSLRDNYILDIIRDKRGNIWVATTSGLFKYVAETDDFDFYELNNINPEDTYRYRVIRSLAYDSLADRMFIGTYGGLHIIDLVSNRQEHLIHQSSNTNSLSINSIFRVLFDKERNGLWLCTYGGGLNYYNLSTRQFYQWFHDPSDRESIGSNNVVGIFLDRQGLLWAATAETGLYLLNTRPAKFHRIIHHSRNPNSISEGTPRTVYAENDSIIWIGFNGTGLNRMNLLTGRTTRFRNNPADQGSIAHNAVISIDGDKHGRIWIGMDGGGVGIYDYQTKSFERLRYQPGKLGILNDAISSILVDDDLVWISAIRAPLTVYNRAAKKYFHFNADSLWKQGISFHAVRRIRKYDNNIWFETGHGAVVFDKQSQTFKKLSAGNERIYTVFVNNGTEAFYNSPSEVQLLLAGNQVHVAEYNSGDTLQTRLLFDGSHHPGRFADLVMDRNKVLWILTESYLLSYNTQTQEERIFDEKHGLEVSNMASGLLTDVQGRIYTVSNKGLIWFDPLTLDESPEDKFPVKFSALKIFNHEVPINNSAIGRSTLNQHISHTSKIRLKPTENFFSLSFSALYFQNPNQVSYRYRLKGFNDAWVESGNTNFASFTNLSPGVYTLEVQASTNPLVWGSNKAVIQIEVLPPFWRTGWFMAGMLGLIGISLYGAHQYRVNQKLQLERLRTKIASDLHDEVGSSLTRISIYSDLLDNGANENQQRDYLKNIKETSREVVSTMSDIVWSVDNRSDSLGDLLLRMKDFAAQLLAPKNIEFEFAVRTSDDKILLSPQVKQNLYLIYKEALHNIVKHANARHVSIHVSQSTRKIVMQIEDDGIGFLEEESGKGNGLRSMRKRAGDIRAQFELKIQGGTSINLSCPLKT